MSNETAPLSAVRVEPVVRCEWGFTEPPEQVDLQRIWNEAGTASGIMFYSYMRQLYKHAPKTYTRLRDWRMSQGCSLVNWDYDPHGRFTMGNVTHNAALTGGEAVLRQAENTNKGRHGERRTLADRVAAQFED